jgi:hypothetical protein
MSMVAALFYFVFSPFDQTIKEKMSSLGPLSSLSFFITISALTDELDLIFSFFILVTNLNLLKTINLKKHQEYL